MFSCRDMFWYSINSCLQPCIAVWNNISATDMFTYSGAGFRRCWHNNTSWQQARFFWIDFYSYIIVLSFSYFREEMITYCVRNKFVACNPKMGRQFLMPGTIGFLVIAIRMEPGNIFARFPLRYFTFCENIYLNISWTPQNLLQYIILKPYMKCR